MNLKDLRIETAPRPEKTGIQVVGLPRGVRVTHIPTGLFAESLDERSQTRNLKQAMNQLKAILSQKGFKP